MKNDFQISHEIWPKKLLQKSYASKVLIISVVEAKAPKKKNIHSHMV